MAEVNGLDEESFVARLGHLYEGSPWITAEAWSARPFADRADLHRKLEDVVARAPRRRQLELIRAHPDLVGRAALSRTLGTASSAEQAAAGLERGRLTPEEIAAFGGLNRAYRERFGFPFVICARENRRASILAGFRARLGHEPEREVATALSEIGKISGFRLVDEVEDGDPARGTNGGGAVDGGFAYEIGYGKRGVAVYRTAAAPLRVPTIPESAFVGRENGLLAAAIDVEVLGDEFLPAYTLGDNSMVVATDSIKNFILRETLAYGGATVEGLLFFLGTRFVGTYEQLRHLRLAAREIPFSAVSVPVGDGFGSSAVLFSQGGSEAATATLELRGDGDGVTVLDHRCGRVGLRLMKLSGSAFTAFVRDGYTTLPERRDRPLFVYCDLHWRYADPRDLLAPDHARYVPPEQVRDVVGTVFAGFVSESIQHLVHEMGTRLLGRFPQLAEVGFVAENRTRDPAADFPEGAAAKVYTDPFPAYGEIRLTMRRSEGGGA